MFRERIMRRDCLEMLENKGLQPQVDKIQGVVGGYVKAEIDNLGTSNPGGGLNDNC